MTVPRSVVKLPASGAGVLLLAAGRAGATEVAAGLLGRGVHGEELAEACRTHGPRSDFFRAAMRSADVRLRELVLSRAPPYEWRELPACARSIRGYSYNRREWLAAAVAAEKEALASVAAEARRGRLAALANTIRRARGSDTVRLAKRDAQHTPAEREQADAPETLNLEFSKLSAADFLRLLGPQALRFAYVQRALRNVGYSCVRCGRLPGKLGETTGGKSRM